MKRTRTKTVEAEMLRAAEELKVSERRRLADKRMARKAAAARELDELAAIGDAPERETP